MANDSDGCHVATVIDETFFMPEPSGWQHLQDTTVTGLGMHPVVDYLEPGQHRGTVVNEPTSTLPEPDRAAVQQRLGQVDYELLDLMHHEQRGVIRLGPAVDRAALIAEIALAFPETTIAVAVATCEQARHLGKQLRRWLNDVTVLTRDHEPGYVGRIVVAPFLKMAFYAVRIEHRNIFIAADALEVLSERGTEAMDHAWRARFYALLPDAKSLAPYDEAKLRSYFGFHEVHILQSGHRLMPVSVMFSKVQGGPHVSLDATDMEIKRWLWTNPLRNRRIVALAKALYCGDWQTIQQRFPELGYRTGAPAVRVAVLVENIQHALVLAKLLPEWRLLTGSTVCQSGLSQTDRQILAQNQAQDQSQTQPAGKGNLIVTATGMEYMDMNAVDVLVRADGGSGMVPLPNGKLDVENSSASKARRLYIVDFLDMAHPRLRKWVRSRKAAYRRSGWYAPGADPVEERAKDFCTARGINP